MATIEFDTSSSEGRRAIVVSFDLCGFSDFCKHPEAYAVLPKFISAVFDELNLVFIGSLEEFWEGLNSQTGRCPAPAFIKYTGDGALMIWFPPEEAESRQKYCSVIVVAMRRFRQRLAEIVPRLEIEWQIDHLPQTARFGIAAGLVYPLKTKSILPDLSDPADYAGYCINLAVRLQDHCPEVGFIIHELVFPKLEGLIKFVAHGMKGTGSEPVLMFSSDIPAMTWDYIKSKFLPCGNESEIRCQITQREFKKGKGTKESPVLVQPRFEALLVGPKNTRQHMFLDEAYPEFIPVRELKDDTGKTVGKEKCFFKLTSKGPPLIYQFVRSENVNDR